MLGNGLLNLHTDFFIIFANTIDKSAYFVIQCNTRKEVFHMIENLTSRDIDDGKKISAIFSTLSEENKTMAIVYLSALRDKEIADSSREKEVRR